MFFRKSVRREKKNRYALNGSSTWSWVWFDLHDKVDDVARGRWNEEHGGRPGNGLIGNVQSLLVCFFFLTREREEKMSGHH